MKDKRISLIIPFHTSLHKDVLKLKGIDHWVNYKNSQMEKVMVVDENGNIHLKNAPTQINFYTEILQAAENEGKPIKNATEFQERYLALCKQKGVIPKFSQFLDVVNGEYVPTEGYEKFLVDFKMFDEEGNYLSQEVVKPIFDNDLLTRIVNDYVEDTKKGYDLDETYNKVVNALGLKSAFSRKKGHYIDGSLPVDMLVSARETIKNAGFTHSGYDGTRYPRYTAIEDSEDFVDKDYNPEEFAPANSRFSRVPKGVLRIMGEVVAEIAKESTEVVTDKAEMQRVLNKNLSEIWQDLTTPLFSVTSSSPKDVSKLQTIRDNLQQLEKTYSGKHDKRGVVTDLAVAFETNPEGYKRIILKGGNEVLLRFSNHNANADKYAERGEFNGNISIVFKRGRSKNTFNPNDAVELTEYVYTAEDIAKDGNLLSQVAQSLGKMLDTGVYEDLSGKALVNKSPLQILQKMTVWHESANNAAKIINRTQFLKTSQGEVYGFVKDGKMYLDPDLINPNTPIHEYGHLWDAALQKTNPELWNRWKDLVRGTDIWNEVVTDAAYADIKDNEDLVASEVKSRLTGAEGERRLQEMVQEASQSGSVMDAAQKISFVDKAKRLLRQMWEATKQWLADSNVFRDTFTGEQIRSMSVEDFVNKTLNDFAEGVVVSDLAESQATQFRFIGEKGARNADKAEGTAVRMDNLKVAEVMERPKDKDVVKRSVLSLFKSAAKGDVSGKPIAFGALTVDGRKFLEDISGLTMKQQVRFVLNPSDLSHIHNNHYGENEKDTGNNIPLNEEDIKSIVDVVEQPDHVMYVKDKEGRKMFLFLKEDGNSGAYNMAEVYSDRHGNLTTKSFYKTRKGVSQRVMALQPELSTSETDGATLSSANIETLFDLNYGFEPKIIKLATGWERGADGQWRYEESDTLLTEDQINRMKDGSSRTLDNILGANNPLFNTYPQLRNYWLTFMPSEDMKGNWGSISDTSIDINESLTNDDINETFVHEIQHAIQVMEGFATGGDWRIVRNYDTLAGEVEAVNAASRRNMTYQERRSSLASETEDVPRDEQIVMFDSNGVSNSMRRVDNPGYTTRNNGNKISKRAAAAEEEGRFTEGRFRQEYGVAKNDFKMLQDIGVIENTEWHHTGADFKKSDFFGWGDYWNKDYTDANPEDGSYGDVYTKNKGRIGAIVKDAQEKTFASSAEEDNGNGIEENYRQIAQIFGLGEQETESAINTARKEYQRAIGRNLLEQEKSKARQRADAAKKTKQDALDKWLKNNIEKGNISEFNRVRKADLPDFNVVTKSEMNGKYGWFSSSYRYNMPEYYSGYAFKDRKTLERYKSMKQEIDNAEDQYLRDWNDAMKRLTEAGYRFRMGDTATTFKERQRKAVENKGTVMPGLNEASVEVVDVPMHSYSGNIKEATQQARQAAVTKYTEVVKDENGEEYRVSKPQFYDNHGQQFDYVISVKAIDESLNPSQPGKSENKAAHLSLAEHIDEVIANSIEVEEHPDYLKNDKDERDATQVNPNALMHRFYGAVNIDGKTYRVMTLMREDKRLSEGNGLYAYEVQIIELLPSVESSSSNGAYASNVQALVPVGVAKLLQGVEKSYDKGKKLLDYSLKAEEYKDYMPQIGQEIEQPDAIAQAAADTAARLGAPVRVVGMIGRERYDAFLREVYDNASWEMREPVCLDGLHAFYHTGMLLLILLVADATEDDLAGVIFQWGGVILLLDLV